MAGFLSLNNKWFTGTLFSILFIYLLNKKIQHGPDPEVAHLATGSKRNNPAISHQEKEEE